MPRGKAHSAEVKAAVMSALLTGQGVCEVADSFGLNESTVRNWKKKIDKEQLAEVSAKKNEDFEGLLVNYVCTNLRTLSAQSEEVGKPEYVKKQDAAALATLHGVIADKTIRILSAFEPAE